MQIACMIRPGILFLLEIDCTTVLCEVVDANVESTRQPSRPATEPSPKKRLACVITSRVRVGNGSRPDRSNCPDGDLTNPIRLGANVMVELTAQRSLLETWIWLIGLVSESTTSLTAQHTSPLSQPYHARCDRSRLTRATV